jgi:ribosome maturation factor RimP
MQDEDRSDRIEETIGPVLQGHGLELVDLEWHARRPRGVLRVFVDKAGGVGIADCERASREIGDVLEVSGLIDQSYDLEVSSPGLDRLLRKDREFRWAVGKRVRCWVAGGEETRGRLVEVDAQRLVLETDGGRVEVPRQQVTKTRLEVDAPWPRRG